MKNHTETYFALAKNYRKTGDEKSRVALEKMLSFLDLKPRLRLRIQDALANGEEPGGVVNQ